jgi:hypothetical protein
MNEKNFKTNSLFFSLLFNYQNLEYELINEQSGEGLCPYDPTHLSTATFFGKFAFYYIDIFVKLLVIVLIPQLIRNTISIVSGVKWHNIVLRIIIITFLFLSNNNSLTMPLTS